MIADIIFGGQFGDEGKGKVISFFAERKRYSAYARAGVGPNAGHSVYHNGVKFALRQLPSGFLDRSAELFIGAGVLVNPEVLEAEIKTLEIPREKVHLDYHTGVITKEHIEKDSSSANSAMIGTTKTGCGPAMEERVGRRMKLAKDCPELSDFVCDVSEQLHKHERVLIEGSQGFMLSNYHGTYPFVTSKDTGACSFLADVGVGPKEVGEIIMVIKSYTTRVGKGPFKDELEEDEIREAGLAEFGTVTGRMRRVSKSLHWEDLKKTVRINSPTAIALTKLDILFPDAKGVTEFGKLSQKARDFVQNIEKNLGVPVKFIGTGPNDVEMINRLE